MKQSFALEQFVHPGLMPVDEYLVDGNGTIVHSVRLLLGKEEVDSIAYVVPIQGFKCPGT